MINDDNKNSITLINNLPSEISTDIIKSDDFAAKYEALNNLLAEITKIKKDIDNKIKNIARDQYMETGDATIVGLDRRYTYIPGTTREIFNTQLFKSENPDLYKKYVRISSVSDSFKTFKKKEKEEGKTE